MRWRRIPPVLSPIVPRALVRANVAALGLISPQRQELEADFTTLFSARETILTGSGTSALVLAICATVPPGSIVAMPGYACIDIIAAAIRARVRVVLYDLDPQTLTPDIASVRDALARGATALVAAPLYGYPQEMAALAEAAAACGVPIIEDAAQSAGATLEGIRVGAFGDLSVLSFGRGKGMTGGSGGALLIRKPSLVAWGQEARRALRKPRRGARDVVALAAQWMLARPALYSIPASIPALGLGEMVYHAAGEPEGISTAAATVLRTALAGNEAEVRVRRARAAELTAASSGSSLTPVRLVPGANPGYLRLALLDTIGTAVPDPHLGALRGYPITLDEHPATRRVLVDRQPELSGARVLRDRLFTLPTHSLVSSADVARLSVWLRAGARR
jgi:perosamine synthetase